MFNVSATWVEIFFKKFCPHAVDELLKILHVVYQVFLQALIKLTIFLCIIFFRFNIAINDKLLI